MGMAEHRIVEGLAMTLKCKDGGTCGLGGYCADCPLLKLIRLMESVP